MKRAAKEYGRIMRLLNELDIVTLWRDKERISSTGYFEIEKNGLPIFRRYDDEFEVIDVSKIGFLKAKSKAKILGLTYFMLRALNPNADSNTLDDIWFFLKETNNYIDTYGSSEDNESFERFWKRISKKDYDDAFRSLITINRRTDILDYKLDYDKEIVPLRTILSNHIKTLKTTSMVEIAMNALYEANMKISGRSIAEYIELIYSIKITQQQAKRVYSKIVKGEAYNYDSINKLDKDLYSLSYYERCIIC